jgi:hypothetical protein
MKKSEIPLTFGKKSDLERIVANVQMYKCAKSVECSPAFSFERSCKINARLSIMERDSAVKKRSLLSSFVKENTLATAPSPVGKGLGER